MDQSEQQNAGGEAVKQEQTPSGPPTTETKMEVDAPATAVKEEKMEVDGAESEKEKEKVKEEEKEEDTRPKILLSGMENSQRKQMIEIISRLDGVFTEDPAVATHLVMPKLTRTNNFLLCLPTIKHILKESWITESDSNGSWVSEEAHMLEDTSGEARFNFSVAKTLARSNRDKLFSGKTFYLTPSVKPSLQVLSQIITSSGGR